MPTPLALPPQTIFPSPALGSQPIAYLETDVDRNVSLYEKFGFQVIGQADILGINDRRFMRRDAKTQVT